MKLLDPGPIEQQVVQRMYNNFVLPELQLTDNSRFQDCNHSEKTVDYTYNRVSITTNY